MEGFLEKGGKDWFRLMERQKERESEEAQRDWCIFRPCLSSAVTQNLAAPQTISGLAVNIKQDGFFFCPLVTGRHWLLLQLTVKNICAWNVNPNKSLWYLLLIVVFVSLVKTLTHTWEYEIMKRLWSIHFVTPQWSFLHRLVNPVSSISHLFLLVLDMQWQLKCAGHQNMRMQNWLRQCDCNIFKQQH